MNSAALLDPSRQLEWVTSLNTTRRLVYGYIFRRQDYPWIQYWGQYLAVTQVVRGMEFGTQPYDVPRREAISLGSMFETPSYRWLPAKSKIESHFLLFYSRVPEGSWRLSRKELRNEGYFNGYFSGSADDGARAAGATHLAYGPGATAAFTGRPRRRWHDADSGPGG